MKSTSALNSEQDVRSREFARHVLEIFSRDLPLTRASLDYLESTFGIGDLKSLEDFLDETSRTEAEEILEHLFFPETWQRIQLEPLLQKQRYLPEDRQSIVSHIMREKPRIRFVHGQQKLTLPLTCERAALFVRRLKIHKPCPTGLKKSIQAACSETETLHILVRLRTAPGTIQKQSALVLQNFFRHFPDRSDAFWEYFDFLHSSLQEVTPEQDPWTALQAKRSSLETALKMAEQLEHDLRHQAVETLHMRRTSILALNRDQIIKELEMAEYCLNLP